MKSSTSNWNLFGVDLSTVLTGYLSAWKETFWLQGSWGRRHLDLPVEVHDFASSDAAVGSADKLQAWRLNDDYVLFRELHLPVQVASSAIEGIVTAEVNVASPFPAEDTVFGWKVINRQADIVDVVVAISSRHTLNQLFAALPESLRDTQHQFEVWAEFKGESIVIEGFAERRRNTLYRRRLVMLAAALLVSASLLVLAAAAPVVQKKLELSYLQDLHQQARADAREAVSLRTQLAQKNDQIAALNSAFRQSVEPLGSLALLTYSIPESGWLLSFEQRGNRIEIQGLAENAATLMQDLSGIELFEQVRPTSAIRKTGNQAKERYQLEILLPQVGEEVADGQ
ncbi:PilN domain-containing protein [Gilvimarinus agarilyticus]|uniref:PilN domain-containing protein n=1 Tax=Gilvimarinus sp. 2_MG-2023 TaxID=3062666 RepID=UPI001C0A1F8B|nr:PilN domain-containing protein [Gilvimarinus sp. 2_MG-2023]MBU2887576.1 PilN domain-containing protein [Gilvimarinus agarilyticus]MDO6572227.1 PilN domain-containing protein [Gilvimarinus sp. 2_MG-2023]